MAKSFSLAEFSKQLEKVTKKKPIEKIDAIDEAIAEVSKRIDAEEREPIISAKSFPDKWKFCIYEAGEEPVNILSFDLDGNITESTSDGVDV